MFSSSSSLFRSIIRPFHSQNGFKLFKLEEKFKIDEQKLKIQMQKLQKSIHPDKNVNKGQAAQEKSNDLSAIVNDYYNILKDPYKRGKYLLSLMTSKDITQVEDELDKIRIDQSFLLRMMDLREKIDSNDSDLNAELNLDLSKEIGVLEAKLTQDFERKNFANVYESLARMKFLLNCHNAILDSS